MKVDPQPTRRVRALTDKQSELAHRVALFAVVMNLPRPLALLDGFGDLLRDDAQRMYMTAKAWPSGTRQARIALEFGARSDQIDRILELFREAAPALRGALWAQLPPGLKARLPTLASKSSPSPAMECLAARLVREATR